MTTLYGREKLAALVRARKPVTQAGWPALAEARRPWLVRAIEVLRRKPAT